MGLGEEEDEEEEPFDLADPDEEEEPAEMMGLEDEDDEEEEGEEGPQPVRQRIPGLRLAQGLRAKRRARVIAVAALRARRRARLLALVLVRRRRRARLLALAALRARRRTKLIAVAALRARKRARALGNRSRPCTAPNPFTQAGSGRSEAPRVRVNRLASTQRVALDSELRASVHGSEFWRYAPEQAIVSDGFGRDAYMTPPMSRLSKNRRTRQKNEIETEVPG